MEMPFQQWGLDFIGEIHPPSSGQHKWILTATNYFTKWIKDIPTRNATDTVTIKFLLENILSRFGCPHKLVTNNAQDFKSVKLENFCQNHNIQLTHSTPYYPQGNGLAELSNKSLFKIIKKMLADSKRNWDTSIIHALWVDKVSNKRSISSSHFQIVYGTDAIMPMQLALPVMKFIQDEIEEPNSIQRRMLQLIEKH